MNNQNESNNSNDQAQRANSNKKPGKPKSVLDFLEGFSQDVPKYTMYDLFKEIQKKST